MKEMVGGCCVCSDERGWTENPLVYCDGQGCTVAVHQACYGIVSVPSGPWFCRKCESQERAARVKCELCPSKDGALKRTDNSGWAHVVCALYIPEVRFGNVTTMEPIILSMVPTDRFNKACYICEGQGRESKSKFGACMQCNKAGCKQHFHVTCAQALGLLCEEAGNYMDNVKYCGYCQHHYSKLKKGSNVKSIPAFKPLPAAGSAPDSPDKLSPCHPSGSAWVGDSTNSASSGNGSKERQRKKGGRKSNNSLTPPKAGNSRESNNSSVIVEPSSVSEESKIKSGKSDSNPFTNVLAGVGLMPGPRATMNETQSDAKIEPSEMVKQENVKNTEATSSKSGAKKQEKVGDTKASHSGGFHEPPAPSEMLATNFPFGQEKNRANRRKGQTRSVTPSSVGGNDTESTLSNVSDGTSGEVDSEKAVISVPVKNEHPMSTDSESAAPSVIMSSSHASVHQVSTSQTQTLSLPTQPVQRTVSPIIIASASGGNNSSHGEGRSHHNSSLKPSAESGPVLQVKKSRKGGRAPKAAQPPMAPDSPPSSPDSAGVGAEQPAKRRKKSQRNVENSMTRENFAISDQHPLQETHHNHFPHNSINETLSSKESQTSRVTAKESIKEAREPVSESLSSTSSVAKENPVLNLLAEVSSAKELHEITARELPVKGGISMLKDNQIFGRMANGINAPHMLGNQLNPTSSMAQKMTDTLTAELEDHRPYLHSSPSSSNLVGVPFPIRSVSPTTKMNASSGTPFPQNLEQLLERQWEQGSQFLMEQAQHFDIASLLSCLHNLRQENMRLEDHVASLNRRREHLLAVNARLSVPLALHPSQPCQSGSNISVPDRSTPGPPAGQSLHTSPQERNSRGSFYLPQTENGLPENLAAYVGASSLNQHGSRRSPIVGTSHQVHSERVIGSPVIVTSRMNPSYHPVPPSASAPPMMSPVPGSATYTMEGRNLTVLRSTSSTPEMRSESIRTSVTMSQQYPPAYQIVSPPLQASHHASSHSAITSVPQHVVVTSQHSLNARRDAANDPRHPLSRPNPIERR